MSGKLFFLTPLPALEAQGGVGRKDDEDDNAARLGVAVVAEAFLKTVEVLVAMGAVVAAAAAAVVAVVERWVTLSFILGLKGHSNISVAASLEALERVMCWHWHESMQWLSPQWVALRLWAFTRNVSHMQPSLAVGRAMGLEVRK